MSTFFDKLRGMFMRIGGVDAANRRVNSLNIIEGPSISVESSFDERTGELSLTIGAGEGSGLDEQVSATDRILGRDTAGAGNVEELTVSGGLEFTGSLGIRRSALTGDVTAAAGSNATTIANGAIDLVHLSTEVTDAIEAGGEPTGTAGGDLTGTYPNPTVTTGAITLAKMANISSDRLLGRDTPSAGEPEELTLDGGIEFTGGGGIRRSALTGDVTASAGSNACTIANNAVTLAKMATVATDRLLGRDTLSTGNVEELTVGGGVEFTGSGGIQRSALTGDVTCSAGSGTTTIANDAVTTAKIANNQVTLAKLAQVGTDSLLGRDTAGTGNVEEIGLGASIVMSGSQVLERAALTGDVTASAGSNTTSIANDAVTNAKAANMAAATIKGRASGAGTGDPTDLTPAQARTVIGVTLVTAFSGSGSWEKDPTTVWVDFVLVGGGAGGGAVGGGVGGGGGGPGSIIMIGLPASEVPEELTVTIGGAGSSGLGGSNTLVFDVSGFALVAPGGTAGAAGGSGGAGGTASVHGLNSAVAGGNGDASAGSNGSLNPFGGSVGSGATGGPGTGGGGYGAGGGGGASGSDGGGGGAGGSAGTVTAGNGTATDGGAGAGGYVAIIERRG